MFDAGPRFEIRRALGEGGMGVVYEAYDREREELVALKTMRHLGVRSLIRFKREFRALHDLSHPNIVALGELFEGVSEPFFTMELVRGVSFLEYVRGPAAAPHSASSPPTVPLRREPGAGPVAVRRPVEQNRYDEAKLREALVQLARAITAIHDAGLIHRDIKPSNVLVTPAGRVVLLDFGLVADTGSPNAASASSRAGAVGTVAYMAPEQGLSDELTPAADWFSVGVLLFEALTGSLPHEGASPLEMLIAKQRDPAPSPRQLVPDVPSELDSLCAGLLANDPSSRLNGHDMVDRLDGRGPERPASARPFAVTTEHVFVGRTAELAALRTALARSRELPIVALVEGVSGVGKTDLVEAFLEELEETHPDAVVLTGRCYEREVIAYKAFDGLAEALARHLSHLPRVELAGLMPMHASQLSRLFPVMRRVEPIAAAAPDDDAPDPHDQRRRMFTALRELLSRMAERRPLVCFIDDLQWTDVDSVSLLRELLAGEEPPQLLLIATLRPADNAQRRALHRELEELAPTVRVPLTELQPDEARALAELLLPDRDPSLHVAVASEAGGHPLFLHALARHLATRVDATATGASLDEMIAARIATLPEEALRLLEVVALYGGPVMQDVAGRAAGLQPGELDPAARTLRAAHLLKTDGVHRTDRVLTYHDRVREHVTQRLDDQRRRHLHERIAVALAQTDAPGHDPFALVHHARAAGQLDQAARYALAAAGQAVAALAFDQAAELFATAIELGRHDPATLRQLRLDLAAALVHAGRGPEAAEVFLRAADDADPAVRLDCQRRAAEQWITTGHLDRGMDALRASLDEIGEPLAATPRGALARVLWHRARLRVRGLAFHPRVASQVSVEQLRRLDVLRTVAHGLAMVDFIRGADFNGRFLLSALRTGEVHRLVEALATEVTYLSSQGKRGARRARQAFVRMQRLADDHADDAYLRSWVLLADGSSRFFEARFADADAALERCEAMLRNHTAGTTTQRNNARVFRLLATRHMGELARCRTLAHEAIRSGQQRGDRYLEATARLLQAPSLLAAGVDDWHRSGDRGSLWTPHESGYHTQHYYQYNADVELALYQRRAVAALPALRASFAALRSSMLFRVQLVRVIGLGHHGRACLAAATARDGSSADRAEAAATARRLRRERFVCADVLAHLLQAGLEPVGSDRSVHHLRGAVAAADACGMSLHAAAARDRLGRVLGGDEGQALRAAAARYAAAQGIADPDLTFEVSAPGVLAAPPRLTDGRTPAR